jgi:NADPH-dependent glutamate synthase beta subunit-like oxidoreductase/NAD-dependent dihydropyrimidine dehydrogenase PreA subunit
MEKSFKLGENKPMAVKEKVLDLANHISGTKRGSKNEITPDKPEYYILDPVVNNEAAEVGLYLKMYKPLSANEVASKSGKSIAETQKRLSQLADAGVCLVNNIDGIDKYWLEIWAPGTMEHMVNNKANLDKYPQIGKAFDEYTSALGKQAAGDAVFPIGAGGMRVIPIEQAIQGETKRASYEEVSKYLNESTTFSCSDCSCRASREAQGEGCGHPKEDMCIQLDYAAEYYIRTGKGREISREAAFEIINRAEANGLMHSIPNFDGVGKTHAICNCCGCSCFSMKMGAMYANPDMLRSNYVAQVDTDGCVACGECVETCHMNALRLGQKICSTTPLPEAPRELPRDTTWGPDKWNPDYRINRKVVSDTGTSPCKAQCPAHIGIQGYIKLASQGRYTEALELIKYENPFPAVCGRICPRACESVCTRGDIDAPIAIDDIKRFISEQDLNQDRRYIPKVKNQYENKIAIVGAGPGGLSCAYFLAVEGYQVTVFEKEKVLGGMLTLGIPSFRLEKEVVNAEIDILREIGVAFETGIEVGKDVSLNALRQQGFEAFYIAIGAQAGRHLGIAGEDAAGVTSGVDFLRRVNLNEDETLKGETVVIGGGNVAIDVARAAVRVGSSEVEMYCLESRDEMPSLDEEISQALAEGIGINNAFGPERILTEHGRAIGVVFKKCVSVFDENGRFSPKYDESETRTVKADNILVSIGQAMDWGDLLEGGKLKLNPNGTIVADPDTYQAGDPDVFAGGDAFTGPKLAIDAIALGKEGAISIHRFVQPGKSLVHGRIKREYCALDKAGLDLGGYDRLPRQRSNEVDGQQSRGTFRDLRATFTEDQLKKETERCLGCGAVMVDEFMCVGCGSCTTKCKFDAISLVKKYDATGVELKKVKPTVAKYMLKRQLKITTKKVITSLKSIGKASS